PTRPKWPPSRRLPDALGAAAAPLNPPAESLRPSSLANKTPEASLATPERKRPRRHGGAAAKPRLKVGALVPRKQNPRRRRLRRRSVRSRADMAGPPLNLDRKPAPPPRPNQTPPDAASP